MRRETALVLAVLALCASASSAQAPSLADVLRRAAESARAFNRSVPLLAADERADDVARGFGLQGVLDRSGIRSVGQKPDDRREPQAGSRVPGRC